MKYNTYFNQILDFCEREKEYKVLSNRRDEIIGMKFHMDWIALDVTVQVLQDKDAVAINTVLPVTCREGNEDKLKIKLNDCNAEPPGGLGNFVYVDGRITYVTVYSYDREQEFSRDVFESHLDSAVMIPYLKAKEIFETATRPVLIPNPPFRPFWMEDEHGEDEDDEYPDDCLQIWPMKKEKNSKNKNDEENEEDGWLW